MNNSDTLMLENLLENMTDGVFIVGYDGKIRMENAVAADILGISSGPLYGKSLTEMITRSDDNDSFFRVIIDAVFQRRKLSDIVTFYRYGESRLLRLIVSPLRDRNEDIAAIVVFSDITEIVDLGNRNNELTTNLRAFFSRFVKLMVGAIDTRSHYNANHTRSMVHYAENYLIYLDEQRRGLGYRHKIAFITSIWMHDIGKLVIPLELMDKPTRLANSEKDVFHRIEVAILCEKLRHTDDSDKRIAQLEAAAELVKQVNTAPFVDGETKAKIAEIANIKCLTSTGEFVPLLTPYEQEALSVERGTLTNSERKQVQSHVVHTYKMLTQMHFDGMYEDVPKWAGSHHELMDGTGYPNGLTGDDLSWEVRLLTILDIYDALTADDRPYKPPMPPEKAFKILRNMSEQGKIDGEILEDFFKSKAWEVRRVD